MSVWRWLKRWRKTGYRKLWYSHYGGAHEGDKGCEREYTFMAEIASAWHQAFENERSLRLEAEQLLRDNFIEVPAERRNAELLARLRRNREVQA